MLGIVQKIMKALVWLMMTPMIVMVESSLLPFLMTVCSRCLYMKAEQPAVAIMPRVAQKREKIAQPSDSSEKEEMLGVHSEWHVKSKLYLEFQWLSSCTASSWQPCLATPPMDRPGRGRQIFWWNEATEARRCDSTASVKKWILACFKILCMIS